MAKKLTLDERIEFFNSQSDTRYLEEILEEEKKELEEAVWESYSAEQIQMLLSLTEDETRKLLKSGLFKIYRVGNEYRASKKSVEENHQIVRAMMNYKNKKTMSVPDLRRILGLGKTAVYRLVNQQHFKTFLVFGQMRVDVESFEEWYASQFHYRKVNGERPGKNYGRTLAPTTVAKVLGIPRGTANDLMNNSQVEFIWVDGTRRIVQESFEKWYSTQTRYKKIMEIEEVEKYVD